MTGLTARRPQATADDSNDQYALDSYASEKPATDYARPRPLAKDNASLLSASSWLQSDETLRKGKLPQGSAVSRRDGTGPKGPLDFLGGGLNLSSGECKVLALVVLVACCVRLYRLDRPSSVV